MRILNTNTFHLVGIVAITALTGLPPIQAVAADSVQFRGFIKARNGDTMVLQTSDSPHLVVLLTDSTKVGQVEGLLKARRKEMSMAALIPGLAVNGEGEYNSQNELVATEVSFKGNDLQRAQSVQAGMHETEVRSQENEARSQRNKEQLEQHQETITQQQQQISANKADINAAVARFGQLDDYYIRDEVTVYFANGKSEVDPQYTSQLEALAQKAKAIDGYMIEVKGYTSSSGSTEFNQQLSEDRADRVTNILIQQGHIPLTRMLAPGAMGESHQIGNQSTEEGETANRRVVVRVLQNKAVAGA
jgi:outer membrane protein OmpA-like peptidoglycan-associated protein